MPALELGDIQGILARGYGRQEAACFVLLGVDDAKAARSWLSELAGQVTTARESPPASCLNVAFTRPGLEVLGLGDDVIGTFSPEFKEGMTTEHRSRILGDSGESAPERWDWGGPTTAPIHILLMLYDVDDPSLAALYASHASRFVGAGVSPIGKLETISLKTPQGWRKEHFGFRDGVAQPVIPELKKRGDPKNWVPAGEFVLGYPNAYGQYTERPLAKAADDPDGFLPEDVAGSRDRDLGRNGSYLVFRQLSQDVGGFWRYFQAVTKRGDGEADVQACIGLAAKMVGRWPSGAPLVKSPDTDDPALGGDDDFGYHSSDRYGLRCPKGAHIRRTNPRDALDPRLGAAASTEITNRHRLLRRGRPYGKPVAASLEPIDMLEANAAGERGLHFICCCANLGRQFELVQHAWANNPKFAGLYEGVDPLIGDRDPYGLGGADTFTIQARPIRRRVTGLPQFVVVRGGAYFFLPGIRALRFLASLR